MLANSAGGCTRRQMIKERQYKSKSDHNPLGLVCPKCGSSHMRRVKREGFWQVKFWPRFGMFPWECAQCRQTSLFRCRGERKRRESSEATQPI
jgi:predicted RNA-binding Zn-ribbon protein involved in translation (DUF1610 family)